MDTVDARKPSSGLTQLTIRYDLYDGVETTLAFHGVSVQDLVRRAFIEVANAANGFDVVRQNFEIKANGRSLWFNAAAYPRLDQGEICLCVTLGEDPHKYEAVNEFVEELISEFGFARTTNTTKH